MIYSSLNKSYVVFENEISFECFWIWFWNVLIVDRDELDNDAVAWKTKLDWIWRMSLVCLCVSK